MHLRNLLAAATTSALLLGAPAPRAAAGENPHPVGAGTPGTLVCVGAKVYPSPTAPPIEHAVLIIRDGKIHTVAAGDPGKNEIPRAATTLPCAGKVVVAGFWNSHVHFETGWQQSATRPAVELEGQLRDMLNRWGFTTVWDLGSTPEDTLALRHRIEAGELAGPRILMAGDIF